MFKKIFLLTFLAFINFQQAAAFSSKLSTNYIKEPVNVGSATLKFLFWPIYKAELYAANAEFDFEQPFILRLTYKFAISKEDIVEASLKEIKRQAEFSEQQLALWEQKLAAVIPDVAKNDSIYGIKYNDRLIMIKDEQLIADIKDAELAKRFFAIWLGEKSSRPKLTKKLLGKS